MSLRCVGCVEINGFDCRFSIDLYLSLRGLLLLNLSAIILIVVDSHAIVRHFVVGASSAVIMRSRAASSELSCFSSSCLPHVFEMMDSS